MLNLHQEQIKTGLIFLISPTGRVSLSDPNIQAIPRDFEIKMPSAIGESPPLGAVTATGLSYPTRARSRRAQGRDQQGRNARMTKEGCDTGSFAVSVRHAFCPFQGNKCF